MYSVPSVFKMILSYLSAVSITSGWIVSLVEMIGEPPVFSTELGALFRGDCTELLPRFPDACVNTIFADPPFNLGKQYGATRGRPPGR